MQPPHRPVHPPEYPRFLPAGEAALVVELGDRVDEVINDRVLALDARLADAHLRGVEETIPTYRSLMVLYDPEVIGFAELVTNLRAQLHRIPDPVPVPRGRCWTIPVVYGDGYGEDLGVVAVATRLSEEDVAARHAGREYRVFMIGFQPGFAYLGGLDPALHVPRRSDPRARVPAGSVAIGGVQTAVYSVECPSGWHLLGRTPVRVFDPARREPFLLAAGDRVRFRRVPPDAWGALVRRVEHGEIVAEPEAPP